MFTRIRSAAAHFLTPHALLLTVLGVAVCIRIAMLYAYHPVLFNDTTGFEGPTFVPLSYRELALAILNWDLSNDLGTRAPGYPAFMAGFFKAFGLDSYRAITVAQSILGVVVFFAAYYLWSQIYGRGWAAALATATAVLEPTLILTESNIGSESLTAVLLLVGLAFLVHAARRIGIWSAVASGIAIAWLSLTRPAFELLIPLFGLYLVFALGPRFRTRSGVAIVALFLTTAGLPVVGWNAFNYHRFGYFTMMTTQGYIFTSHSAPLIGGEPQRYGEDADLAEIAERYAAQNVWGIWLAYPEVMNRRNVSFVEGSRLMQKLSLEIFRDRPVGFMRSVYRSIKDFWDANLTTGQDLEQTSAFAVLRSIYTPLHAVGCILFGFILAFDISRPSRWREPAVLERMLILMVVLIVCIGSTVPIAGENSRYKIPLLPLLWGVVAGSLVTNRSRLQTMYANWR